MEAGCLSPLPVKHVHVARLSLSHFRNYHTAQIETALQPVMLVGANGAGKTNLLEALSLLAPGRGLRRATISEMDTMGDNTSWAVSAELSSPAGMVMVGTGRDPENSTIDKRIVKIDGKITRSHAELAKIFSVLWLTPQMDTLFIEGGTVRRKFLDRLVYSFDGDHATRVTAYEQAMRERNRLLQIGASDPSWLAALEHQMAGHGIAIAVARQHAVERLNQMMHSADGAFPRAELALTGIVETDLARGSALAAEEKLQVAFARNRTQDVGAGRCLVGVHRTHVEVMHSKKNLPVEHCSTGEQKALLVSILLAQVRAGSVWHGRMPVLLLDEVATHLDAMRRAALFEELMSLGVQSWLTGTDREMFKELDGRVLEIDSGQVLSR